jgi:hypothetical protein
MSEDVFKKLIYNYYIYRTKISNKIILNRDLWGVFLEIKAKKTYNY